MDLRTVPVSSRFRFVACLRAGIAMALVAVTFTPIVRANIRELDIAGAGSADQQRIRSAVLDNGWMVFVWEDRSGLDSEAKYRLFNPALSQFSVIRTANADSAGDQVDPVITPLSDGGFAIAFASRPANGDYDVKFRRFDFTGAPVDMDDVPVNTATTGSQQHPDITRLNDGSIVVAFSGPGGAGQDVFFRRFSTAGVPLDASEVGLNAFGSDAVVAGDQAGVRIDAFAEGGWVAVFEDRASDDLYGVRFSNAGAPRQDPGGAADEFYFRLNEDTPHEQFAPSLTAFGDGQFATAYNSDTDGTAAGRRVLLRIFNSGGPVTGEIQVGASGQRSQDAAVALIGGPSLAVAWRTLESGNGGQVWSVYSQVFTLDGSPSGSSLFMHADRSLNHARPHLIPWLDGGFATVWETGDTGGTVGARTVAPFNVGPGVLSASIAGPPESPAYHVSFVGFPGECYQLRAADELNDWTTVLTTNAPSGGFLYTDPDGAVTAHRFFQVKRVLSGFSP